jgi:hypothetical protein
MKSRKSWLITKGVLLTAFAVIIIIDPPQQAGRKWIQYMLMACWTVTFIIDLSDYKKRSE